MTEERDWLNMIGEWFIGFIEMAFAEASLLMVAVGFVIMLLGAVIALAMLHVMITGYRTEGEIAGAVNQVRFKEKTRDGEMITKRKESLYPVFRYRDKDGNEKLEKSSEGGTGTLKYTTGQKVELIVCPRGDWDDVYDANSKTGPIMALVFIVAGAGVIAWGANVIATLGIGTMTLVIVGASLAMRAIPGDRKNKNPRAKKEHHKHFDPEDLKPIEYFKENKSKL